MSLPGTYSFLPWLRQGLANQIQAADGDPAVQVRATVEVKLELRGEKLAGGTETVPVTRDVALFGPGDILGIDQRAIVRVEPRHWITNFEPNYLAHIEFYDEDFPFRYTPAAPDLARGRLRPWIALVVLAEGEFEEGKNAKDKPLPYIEVSDLALFPAAEELWAWAHVHVNRPLTASESELVSSDMGAVLPKLAGVLREDPDLAYSRLLCPRRLDENKAYHAFVVPVFETGRRAGLGLDVGTIAATMSAWAGTGRPAPTSFPYYHRWSFRTGSAGDFETLVRMLVPRPIDRRVGTREMDVTYPGPGVRPLDNPALQGFLRLGGALRPPAIPPPPPPAPTPIDPWEDWDEPYPRPLQVDLARMVNLADDYQAAGDPDPIISPPLYGTWHAMARRVMTERDGTAIPPVAPDGDWIHRLNLDPRFRAAAGIGTRVVQDNQEKYMDAAWEQVGKVLEAQRRIRLAHFGLLVSEIWFDRHLKPLLGVSRQKALLLMAPLNKRVLVDGVTLHHGLLQSRVQPAMTSAALRRIARPRGRLIKALPFDATHKPDDLLARVDAGEVSAAPLKVAPAGVTTTENAAAAIAPKNVPPWLLDLLERWPQLPLVVLVILLVLALLIFLLVPVAGAIAAAFLLAVGVYFQRRARGWRNAAVAADLLRDEGQTPAAIDALPGIADFRIAEPDSGFVPRLGGADSAEAGRFKIALRETFTMVEASTTIAARPPKVRLDVARTATAALDRIAPAVTIPKRLHAGIAIPPRLASDLIAPPRETFVEPMAYPVIDQPMYEPLKDRSSELFLPNINLIEANTISLLETNQRFIESYMVGLNHEFARELLWREYPTDQRGTSFRQFWDVRSFFDASNATDEVLKERLRDIPPLHRWSRASALGTHDHRETGGAQEEEVVLVIRGELLKRYPTAVIYAHRACWQRKSLVGADAALEPCARSGPIDPGQERRLVTLTAAEEANPPPGKILTPLYDAKVDPDIYFFGFDLTVDKARGGSGDDPADDPGWFFVIKERPGEPRFGLDAETPAALQVWNDLSWSVVCPGTERHITIATAPAALPLATPGTADQEKLPQHADDQKVVWSRNMSSAELAYILWQAPVLVAVHASEMLPK
jgi:hypothetical protein